MIKRALTIAGSDSGGGAGLQADLKTFSAFGVYGMSVVTAITAQNSLRVSGIQAVSSDFIRLQLEAVLVDIGADGIKTGMLWNGETIQTVAKSLHMHLVPFVVIDPVMVAKSGDRLLKEDAVDVLRRELIPLATLVTPNIPEAEWLSGIPIQSEKDMKKSAQRIVDLGSKAVLIKGGHRADSATDLLFDGREWHRFYSKKIVSQNTHGTGCTFSAAILSNLVLGRSLIDSVRVAKAFVTRAIRDSLALGKGHGPLNHFIPLNEL